MRKRLGQLSIMMALFLQLLHAAISSSHNMQKLALFQIKLSLATNTTASSFCDENLLIPSYSKMMNWSMSSDCCTWDGVTCNERTRDVIGLDMRCSQLVGPILPNSSLFQLSHLQSLNFDFNDLHGVLPEGIFHLPNLKELSLRFNLNLTVSLPKNKWGSSGSLQTLFIEQTTLSGEIPDSIGYLKSLTFLELSDGNFSGPISRSIGNLTQLTSLYFTYNHFSGPIPDSLANLQNLKQLFFSGNKLIGEIPSWVANLKQLETLDLWGNLLTGQFPSWFVNLTRLETLDLSDNSLTGPLPSKLSALSLLNLNFLNLKHNLLNGTLPSWLFLSPSLRIIYIDYNEFTGQLAEFHSSRSSLTDFSCGNNLLNGTIPQSFSGLVNLTALIFSSNNFSGVLDIEMFSPLEHLEYLDLSHNILSISSTGTTTLLPRITTLSLSSCKIKEFPEFVKTAENLQYLDMSNNQIDGEIPQWNRLKLYHLNLSHNSLTGGIEHLPWNNLLYLDLQSNMLNGSLPASLCNSSSLYILNLSHNNLTGVLPACTRSLDYSLSVFDLRMNSIRGNLPSTLTNFRRLRSLNLHGNKLEGTIPLSFSKFEYLEVLDLGSNRINDTFPQCLEALPSLQVLVLKLNNFHGSIKNNAMVDNLFPSLRIIDLSYNDFSGLLPATYIKNFNAMMHADANKVTLNYMGDLLYKDSISVVIKGVDFVIVRILTVLTTIDLSRNKFEGDIPRYIGNLASLRYLNLSHNHLTGDIPSSVGNLSMLESLDLSSNELVGEIPQQLTDIYSLSVLNLSQNQLSGHIPKGYQFNTFENDSYAGNLGLCGPPLSKKCEREITETQEEDEDDDYFFSGFTWKAVVIGYGGGVMVGLVAGYMMFMAGEPKWFTGIVARELG